ncbi:MAG TPA: MG2 domain-containing protein, partial [Kofleriaceae bacterium]|nr:MG2 domain-containing protein [Kofleriaceae bacterium]
MRKWLWIAITAGVWLAWLVTAGDRCEPAWFEAGLDVESCPDGAVRSTATLEALDVRRGADGGLALSVTAHFTTGDSDGQSYAAVHGVQPRASWLTGPGIADRRPLTVAWRGGDDRARGTLHLPELPDGTYLLHTQYESPVGAGEASVALPLFAAARIHVITDRPLYQPGDTVRFRAVALRARDLVPLDHRPGVWTVRDPDGEILLEEHVIAGDWGVAAGSFPLDTAARPGTWRVDWTSEADTGSLEFSVQPFTLPRFRVEAAAGQSFYRPGEAPGVTGAVTYSSGAPVAGAELDVTWEASGAWPPPTDWLTGGLPRHAVADKRGRFSLALPAVPADLQGMATLIARISARDATGDRVEGAASVLLSHDAIVASAVTELGDGLVAAFNNRLYLRVTRPDGRVVASTKVVVGRAWQPGAPPIEAELDEDGVASVQLDPGAPVNIVVPAAPWRPAPPRPLVTRGETRELIGGRGAALADQVALDRWLDKLAACAALGDGGTTSVKLGVRVSAAGAVIAAGAGTAAIDRCAVDVVRAQRLPAGGERLLAIDLAFADPPLPTVTATIDSALDAPDGLAAALAAAARGARACV